MSTNPVITAGEPVYVKPESTAHGIELRCWDTEPAAPWSLRKHQANRAVTLRYSRLEKRQFTSMLGATRITKTASTGSGNVGFSRAGGKRQMISTVQDVSTSKKLLKTADILVA